MKTETERYEYSVKRHLWMDVKILEVCAWNKHKLRIWNQM